MHSIRLRHPWQCQPAGDGAIWSRKFNWPAGITAGEVAWLIIDGLGTSATATHAVSLAVSLNGETLAPETAGRFNVTLLLARHNRLTISHPDPPPADRRQSPFEVRLDIVEDTST